MLTTGWKLRNEITQEYTTPGAERRFKKLLGGKGNVTEKLISYYDDAVSL